MEEPNKSCLLALRDIIMAYDDRITLEWKFNSPFYYFKGKMFCYVWKHKKSGLPYVGFAKGILIDHPLLELGNRKKITVYR